MIRKTKPVVALLIIALVFSLSACSKIEDKIAEKGLETIVEKTTGNKVDISKDGGKIQVDGNTYEAGEDLTWPQEAMGELPEPKGKITYVMKNDAGKGGIVAVAEYKIADAREYVAKLRELGFKDGMDMEDSDGIMFVGKTEQGASVNFSYNSSAQEASIAYGLE
ncbi:MAG: hypothetical protein ACOWWO_09710 [Peptococcaceae bacterium]